MSDEKTFELPPLTYSERELMLKCLLMRVERLRDFMPLTESEEIKEIQALYHKIQSHF